LAEAFPYLILDARDERVREAGVIVSQAVLIAIGIALTSIVPDLPCLLVMVCILAKGSGDTQSPAYHDHPSRRLLLNFPDTTPTFPAVGN